METHCPRCAMTLLVTNATHAGLFLCPYCQWTFPLTSQGADRQMFLAVDVSRSVVPFLAEMLRETKLLLQHYSETDRCAMRVFTFHRQLLPFPCECLSRPQFSESLIVPTLRDLRGRVAPGSALLDALYQLLVESETQAGKLCDVWVLTDGGERNSHRHPEEVRRRIERSEGRTRIHVIGFQNNSRFRSLIRLMRLLATPRVMWSFHNACPHGARCQFLHSSERPDRWLNQERMSC